MRALSALALTLRAPQWPTSPPRSRQVRRTPSPRSSAIHVLMSVTDMRQWTLPDATQSPHRGHCHISTTHYRHKKIYNLFYIISINSSWLNCVIPIIEMLLFILTVLRWDVEHVCIHLLCVSVSMFAYTVTVWHPIFPLFLHLIFRSLLHAAISFYRRELPCWIRCMIWKCGNSSIFSC